MMAQKKTNGKDPAVLLYTQDFLVGTITWNYEQIGKYIKLLCIQHQKLNKITLTELQSIAGDDELILDKFPLQSDGYYYNTRLAMEIENRKVRTNSSRKNGSKGGRPKKTQEKPIGFDLVDPNKTQMETQLKPKNNPIGNGNGNGNEDVNETVIETENGYEVVDGNGIKDVGERNILLKYLEDCIQTEDKNRFKIGYNEILEYGGLYKVFQSLQFDQSRKNNWSNKIINNKNILGL